MKAPIKNVWSNNADPSNVQISTERMDQGWEKLYIPKAEEFNYIFQENSDAIQNMAQEICNVLAHAHISPQNRDTQHPPFVDKDKDTSKLLTAILAINNMQIPNGTIRMYAGKNWKDNVTLPGWYICNATNKGKTYLDGGGNTCSVPDLSKKFIRGNDGTNIGNEGGSEFIDITQMPSHTHHFSATTPEGEGGHWHTSECYAGYNPDGYGGGICLSQGQGKNAHMGTTPGTAGTHQHTVSGDTSYVGGHYNKEKKQYYTDPYWQPYYDLIYIIKISD